MDELKKFRTWKNISNIDKEVSNMDEKTQQGN